MKQGQNSIQLLSFDAASERFVLEQQGLNFLQQLNKPIAIVSVSGSICTGKSYLLNEIMGQHQQGFKVGCKSTPETKGIWICSTPLVSLNEQYYHVFMDSEGLSSTDKDSNYDLKLLLFQLIVSSTVIYNQFGAIQQSALQTLRSSIELKKYCLEKDMNKVSFADLMWVARDFSLGLVDKSGNSVSEGNYLQTALKDIQGHTSEILCKNQTKKAIRQAFPKRSCYTLTRPALNETVLRSLSQNTRKIKPQFTAKVAQIRKDLLVGSVPKSFLSSLMSVQTTVFLMKNLVNSLNNIGSLGTVGWNSITTQTNQKVLAACLSKFRTKLSSFNLPMSGSQLKQLLKIMVADSEKDYLMKAITEESHDNLSSLKSSMQVQIDLLIQSNTELSKKSQRQQFQRVWNSYSVLDCLPNPPLLKECLGQVRSKLQHKEHWVKFSENLSEALCATSSKLKHVIQEKEQSGSQLENLHTLKQDYEQIKTLHSQAMASATLHQGQVNSLETRIAQIIIQNQQLKAKSEREKNQLSAQKQMKVESDKILLQHKQQISQLKFQLSVAQAQLTESTEQSQQHLKIFLKQKSAQEQQEKFYQKQIAELKDNITVAKSNYERSSENLLQNNQILRNLELIKNFEVQRSAVKLKENNNDEGKLRELRTEITSLQDKTRRLQLNVIHLSQKVKTQQEVNVTLRLELENQMDMNKEVESSKRAYQQMVDSLEQNLSVVSACQQRQRTLYEQSVLRLLENVERREQQHSRREKKNQARHRLSRNQY